MEKTRWTKNGTTKIPSPNLEPLKNPLIDENKDLKAELEKYTKRDKKLKQHLAIPNLNQLYDSLKTPAGWRYIVDAYAVGNVSTSSGGQIGSIVTLQPNQQPQLQKWPGAIQLYICINSFTICPRTVPATAGNITITFVGNNGFTVPFGGFMNTASYTNNNSYIIPDSVIDIGVSNIGLLNFFQSGGTAATYDWSMTFSYVYMLPAQKGYTVHEYDQWKEEVHVYEHKH